MIKPAVEDTQGGVYIPDTSVGAEAYVTAFGVVKFGAPLFSLWPAQNGAELLDIRRNVTLVPDTNARRGYLPDAKASAAAVASQQGQHALPAVA